MSGNGPPLPNLGAGPKRTKKGTQKQPKRSRLAKSNDWMDADPIPAATKRDPKTAKKVPKVPFSVIFDHFWHFLADFDKCEKCQK